MLVVLHWFICRFKQTLPGAFHRRFKCRQIVSGQTWLSTLLSAKKTRELVKKKKKKRNARLPANQLKLLLVVWRRMEGEAGSSEGRGGQLALPSPRGDGGGRTGRAPSSSWVEVDAGLWGLSEERSKQRTGSTTTETHTQTQIHTEGFGGRWKNGFFGSGAWGSCMKTNTVWDLLRIC